MSEIVYTSQEAKFNAAMLSVNRLDDVLVLCNQNSSMASMENDPKIKAQSLINWKAYLEVLIREIGCKLRESKEVTNNEVIEVENLRKGFNNLPRLLYMLPTEYDGNETIMKLSTFNTWYERLHSMELKLRSYANKYKLLIPDKEDSRHAASH
jgi:hypothetical protein